MFSFLCIVKQKKNSEQSENFWKKIFLKIYLTVFENFFFSKFFGMLQMLKNTVSGELSVFGQKEYNITKVLALLCETLYATPIVATTLSFVEANVLSDIETWPICGESRFVSSSAVHWAQIFFEWAFFFHPFTFSWWIIQ